MGALAAKVSTPETPASKHKAEPASARTSVRPAAISPLFSVPMIQRKAGCACGGDCPRCADDSPLQAQGLVDAPTDPLELEADRAAERVMSVSAPSRTVQADAPALSNFATQRNRERDEAQTSLPAPAHERAEMSPLPASVRETLDARGQPLDASTRDFMETRFGYDFGGVRIHTGALAAESAQAVNALAYTVGRNIVFGAGQYEPGTSRGDRLIAHELTHTIQQNGPHALAPTGAARPLISAFKGARLSRLKDQSCKPPLYTSAEKIKCHIIENKPAASDAEAMEEWKKGLRALFEEVPAKDAKKLHDNLSLGEKGDAFAKFFHAQVDDATREEMLGILKTKFAPAPSAPTPTPTPASPTPSADAGHPLVYSFTIQPVRRPTPRVKSNPTPGRVGDTFVQNDENVQVDCEVKFDALIYVKPNQIGRLFFRQYVMSLVRKENACERGPMGVEKGPALDTLEVYNHEAGGERTGALTTTGKEDDVEMIDDDAPSQTVDAPVCAFENGAQVSLYAADKFRTYVMWEPQGGAPVSLGYKEWSWKAIASFKKKSYGEWEQSITDPEGPQDLSGSIVTGDVPQTSEKITPNNIMVGKKKVPSF